jgi:hypothetical protein
LVIKALDPYTDTVQIRIRIGLQHHTLDPDPDPEKINTDPQPCLNKPKTISKFFGLLLFEGTVTLFFKAYPLAKLPDITTRS